jgi:hypothetical protein
MSGFRISFGVALLAVSMGCGTEGSKSLPGNRTPRSAGSEASGRARILRARPAHPGSVSTDTLQALYSKCRDRYGWEPSDWLDFCGQLVEGSMARGSTREALGQEFYAIERLDPGSDLRATAGAIADAAGVTIAEFLPRALKEAEGPERPSPDVVRFMTVMLGDGTLSVWRFTVGQEYHRRYGEQLDPNAFEAPSRELSQTEIDVLLRSFRARTPGR